MVDSSNAPLRARLEALAAYVPVFEDPDFEFAAMQGGNQLEDGAILTPLPDPSGAVEGVLIIQPTGTETGGGGG